MVYSQQTYMLLADATVIVHAAFVLFVVLGQVLILAGWAGRWRWTRAVGFRVSHLAAIAFVVLESWMGMTCPLTLLENDLRRRAGYGAYETGFIEHWLDRLIFYTAPAWVFILIYSLFGLVVLLTFLAYPPRWRGRR